MYYASSVIIADLLTIFKCPLQVCQNIIKLKNTDYYIPPDAEQIILEGQVIQMQDLKTSIWEKFEKRGREINVLQMTVKSILSQLSQVDKIIFKHKDVLKNVDPDNILNMKKTIEDISIKLRYLSLLCISDYEHLKMELLRIRNEVEQLEIKEVSEKNESQQDVEEKCRLGLKQDIVKLHKL
jgi:hypothetical protein